MTHWIYLDNHATTQADPRVVEAMLPYFTEHYGNPGSIGHAFGDTARAAVADSRAEMAAALNVAANEIVFTSGATESNNLAIRGTADRFDVADAHFISAATEHKAVLDPLLRLSRRGYGVTILDTLPAGNDRAGYVEPERVAEAIRDNTRLVSVMLANNEVGTIQPLREIAAICQERGVLLHCDATQAVGRIPVDIDALGVDMLSFSGHKIYGPRGIGVLVVRRRRPRIRLLPLIEGGGQEEGRRSGTLNVPAIVGLAVALRLCQADLDQEALRIADLRQRLYDGLVQSLDDVSLNGPAFEHRLPGNLSMQFGGVDGEALMMNMDGVAVSSGSACTSANPEPSHVLRGIGMSEDATRSSLRFGIGRFNTKADIDAAIDTVCQAVQRLRSLNASH